MISNNIYVTSDFHFKHKKIIDLCARPKDFESRIKKNMEFLTEEHTLICLGDICIGSDAEVHDKYIKPLPCRKILTIGNHDSKSWSWYMKNGWDFVCDVFKLNLFGKNIIFSHIPEIPDLTWDINVHGHLHNTNHRTVSINYDFRRLIALEHTDYKPVNLRKIIDKKGILK